MIRHIGRLVLVLVAGAMLSSRGVAAEDIPWKIDHATALRLAAEGVFGADVHLGWFDYDDNVDRDVSPPFFIFDGLNQSPRNGSFGFFAVNPWTGDVWALWGCEKLSTPALRKSQAEIRRRFTREEAKQYARLRRLKPECIVDDSDP